MCSQPRQPRGNRDDRSRIRIEKERVRAFETRLLHPLSRCCNACPHPHQRAIDPLLRVARPSATRACPVCNLCVHRLHVFALGRRLQPRAAASIDRGRIAGLTCLCHSTTPAWSIDSRRIRTLNQFTTISIHRVLSPETPTPWPQTTHRRPSGRPYFQPPIRRKRRPMKSPSHHPSTVHPPSPPRHHAKTSPPNSPSDDEYHPTPLSTSTTPTPSSERTAGRTAKSTSPSTRKTSNQECRRP